MSACGHYEVALPFRDEVPTLSNNRKLAVKGLEGLKGKFLSNESFHTDYCTFMLNVIDKGCAEMA